MFLRVSCNYQNNISVGWYLRTSSAAAHQISVNPTMQFRVFYVDAEISPIDFDNFYLNVQTTFALVDIVRELQTFPLLGLPLFDQSRGSHSLSELFSDAFDSICSCGRYKTIATPTDDARSMTDCIVGFPTKHTAAALKRTFYTAQFPAHQLMLVIEAASHVITI